MELEEKQFTQAFNAGYLLAQHEPEIMSGILSSTHPNNAYFDGLISGKEQYALEAEQALLAEFENLRNSSKDRSHDFER